MMKRPALQMLLTRLPEQPFWARREHSREQAELLRAAGLRLPGRGFRAPPLRPAFGPGTAFPEGARLRPGRAA